MLPSEPRETTTSEAKVQEPNSPSNQASNSTQQANFILYVFNEDKPGRTIKITIPPEDFFYPLFMFLNQCEKHPESLKNLTLETVDKLHDTLNQIIQTEHTAPTKTQKNMYGTLIDFMNKKLIDYVMPQKFPHKAELFEVIIDIAKKVKSIDIKQKKLSLKSAHVFDHFISETISYLIDFYIIQGDFHRAETHCRKYLSYLNKSKTIATKQFAQADKNMRYFSCKLNLAVIYYKIGYPEVALKFLAETQLTIGKAFAISNYLANKLFQISKDIINFYTETNYLIALETAQRTLPLFLFFEREKNDADFTKTKEELGKAFEKMKEKYLSALTIVMKNSSPLKKVIATIAHDFNKSTLIITTKNEKFVPYLFNAFQFLRIYPEHNSQPLHVNLYHCTPELLAKSCEICLQTIDEDTKEAELKQARVQQKHLEEKAIFVSSQQQAIHNSFLDKMLFFPPSEQSNPEATEKNITQREEKQKNAAQKTTSTKGSTTTNKPLLQLISYLWPSSQLTYCSDEENKGIVKMLTNDQLPNGVWFGYIPEGITFDAHYREEFNTKLSRGKLQKDCIRDITKELKTRGAWNSVSKPYKFKIVIPKHNYRLYGWVEEVYTDDKGKNHYLIRFGYIGDHKLLKLPDPNSLNTMAKSEMSKSEMAKSENNNQLKFS